MKCAGFYTLLKPLHMHVKVYRTREITSIVYGKNAENEPVSRIKMADYRVLVSMGTYNSGVSMILYNQFVM